MLYMHFFNLLILFKKEKNFVANEKIRNMQYRENLVKKNTFYHCNDHYFIIVNTLRLYNFLKRRDPIEINVKIYY